MNPRAALRIGTRASALALWQAHYVAAGITRQSTAPPIELVPISTEGDERSDVPLWSVGGKAFFTKEIDRALLAHEIDVAVHSLKDLSTRLEPGTELAAVLAREDARDALVSRAGEWLHELPRGARVGTSSLRRRAFLTHARADLQTLELRGNVPTRIERLQAGAYDAIILAAAGLKRLGLAGHITCYLSVQEFPPAVSQGAIGVCVRADDEHARRWVAVLDDRAARLVTTAERALLAAMEAGCQVPLGALATLSGGELQLEAAVCALDGSTLLRATGAAPAVLENATHLGERVAGELLEKGAQRLIADVRAVPSAVAAP
jgi:hydroxymethylbilane synthase